MLQYRLILIVFLFACGCTKSNDRIPAEKLVNPTKYYAPEITKTRNWHHTSYFYTRVGNPPNKHTVHNDTVFAFKMLDDSTVYYQTSLKTSTDSTLVYHSQYDRPWGFDMVYNYITNNVSFTLSENAGGGGGSDTYTSF